MVISILGDFKGPWRAVHANRGDKACSSVCSLSTAAYMKELSSLLICSLDIRLRAAISGHQCPRLSRHQGPRSSAGGKKCLRFMCQTEHDKHWFIKCSTALEVSCSEDSYTYIRLQCVWVNMSQWYYWPEMTSRSAKPVSIVMSGYWSPPFLPLRKALSDCSIWCWLSPTFENATLIWGMIWIIPGQMQQGGRWKFQYTVIKL